MVTRGVACNTLNCKTRIHHHCFAKLRARRTQCPACTKEWPQDSKNLTPVGEAAIKDGQDEGRRLRRKSAVASDEEEEEEEFRLEEDEPSQPTQSQRPGKQKQKAAAVDVDEDEDEGDADEAPRRTQANGRRRSTRVR
jgi:hypothetical protein